MSTRSTADAGSQSLSPAWLEAKQRLLLNMREVITLQVGPFANWTGSHFWNVQDEARHPVGYDENGEPTYEDEQADSAILYRNSGRGTQLTPRVVILDMDEAFGNLSSQGYIHNPAEATLQHAFDPLAWGGSVQEVVQEPREAHAFVQMMGQDCSGYEDEYYREESDEDEEGSDDRESDEGGGDQPARGALAHGRRKVKAARPGGERRDAAAPREDEEPMHAAAFNFEASVESWSDFLQTRLHERSLAKLKAHTHGYSTLARFPDGACIVEKEEDTPDGPGLVERVRRYLEECDTLQGFHLLLDADSGFGGTALALMTQIRDDYSRAPCLALGLGTLTRPKRTSEHGSAVESGTSTVEPYGSHSYVPALNDALSLTGFADLSCSYVPLYGSTALRAAIGHPTATSVSAATSATDAAVPADMMAALGLAVSSGARDPLYDSHPVVHAPPMITPTDELRYHTSAPVATLLEAVTLPYRTRCPRGSLHSLTSSLAFRQGQHLATAVLGLPMPTELTLAASRGWLTPLLPFQRRPHTVRAFEQWSCFLGQDGGGRAIAPLMPNILPCRPSAEGGTLYVRQRPLTLPLSYPQYFDRAVGMHGEIDGPSNLTLAQGFQPPLRVAGAHTYRANDAEVFDVPVAAALQSSSAISPSLRRVIADWKAEGRAAERAANTEGWASRDELGEVTEQLASMDELYSEGDVDTGNTSCSGWSS